MKTDRGIWVDLRPEEAWIGIGIGAARNWRGVNLGAKHKYDFEGDPWQKHIEGACGEIAAYKSVNKFWSACITKFKEPGGDGGPWEVRTRSEQYYDHLIRPDEPDAPAHILVLGAQPRFRVVGWLYGWEAKLYKLETKGTRRPPAHFPPQEELHDLCELPGLYDR